MRAGVDAESGSCKLVRVRVGFGDIGAAAACSAALSLTAGVDGSIEGSDAIRGMLDGSAGEFSACGSVGWSAGDAA
jgi:hypothetical protein